MRLICVGVVLLDPPEAVHVHDRSALVLHLDIWLETDLVIHADPMYLGSCVHERKIEAITVICRHDCRL